MLVCWHLFPGLSFFLVIKAFKFSQIGGWLWSGISFLFLYIYLHLKSGLWGLLPIREVPCGQHWRMHGLVSGGQLPKRANQFILDISASPPCDLFIGAQPPWAVWMVALPLQPSQGGIEFHSTLPQLWGTKLPQIRRWKGADTNPTHKIHLISDLDVASHFQLFAPDDASLEQYVNTCDKQGQPTRRHDGSY